MIRLLAFCALGLASLAGCAGSNALEGDANPLLAHGELPGAEPLAQGKYLYTKGHYGLAEKQFRTAVEQDPESLDGWLGLAATYDRLRRFDLATRAYKSAIKIGGETPVVLNNMGYSYLLRGNVAEARKRLLKAQRLDPHNSNIKANLALLEKGARMSRRGV